MRFVWTPEALAELQRLHDEGKPQRTIAGMLGASPGSVCNQLKKFAGSWQPPGPRKSPREPKPKPKSFSDATGASPHPQTGALMVGAHVVWQFGRDNGIKDFDLRAVNTMRRNRGLRPFFLLKSGLRVSA